MSAGPPERVLALLVAEYSYFLSHRLSLARAAANDGYKVFVFTNAARIDPGSVPAGINIVDVRISRSAGSPLRDLLLVWRLVRKFRELRPAILHNVSIKLVMLGSCAAIAARVPVVINAFTGLGYAFRSTDRRSRCLALLLRPLLQRFVRRRHSWGVFQNEDDLARMRELGVVDESRCRLIPGSGVDTGRFTAAAPPAGPPVVLFVGRLLWDKGIGEFVEAARRLRAAGSTARFVVVGGLDSQNPRSVPALTQRDWREEGIVEFRGQQADVVAEYRNAHIVCLPSYHEGLPMVLLEAAACGLPVVASDIPGCRSAVEDGVSGVLVRAGDAAALVSALERLLADSELRERMGRSGRARVERFHSAAVINPQFLALYRDALREARP